MSTDDYIPPPKELRFYPVPPPVEITEETAEKTAEESTTTDQKWVLEIGPGKGEFILHLAQSQPQVNFVAVEVRRFRYEKICRQIDKLELKNLYMIHGDARECLPRLFPNNFFEEIIVLFPDPWPKKRHAKHRLLKPRLIKQLQDFLKPGGHILNATDAGFYSEQIVESFEEVGGFNRQAISSPFPTYFEQKWIEDKRNIDYWKFVKVA